METVMAERRVRVPVKIIVREGMMFMWCDDDVLCGGVAMLYILMCCAVLVAYGDVVLQYK